MIHYTAKDAFCDKNGIIDPKLPQSVWTVKFEETGDTTIVTIEIAHEKLSDLVKIMEMGFKEGFIAAIVNLEELLDFL